MVVQGSNLGTTTSLSLWVNGVKLPVVSGTPSAGCGWQITSNPITLPENLANLKHLRLYTRTLSTEEIQADANNPYFTPYNQTASQWFRFNKPSPGGETTLGDTSTVETQYAPVYPAHRLTTTYAYNSTNQVVQQSSPDGGESRFWYDQVSRLVISQNAKQLSNNYSYTRYDSLGRIIEVGQKNTSSARPVNTIPYMADVDVNNFYAAGVNSQITQTFYDTAPPADPDVQTSLAPLQDNLRKRVSASVYRETATATNINATYYSYDLEGNVKTLWQQVAGLGLKKLDYEYDLVSGKVNFISYQHGQPDQFYYWYNYDAENRLIKAWSSVRASSRSPYGIGSRLTIDDNAKLDASYRYYLHGPLARMELGNEGAKLQGVDYAYTLQGWLKGVNGQALDASKDMGNDGAAIPSDVIAYSLGYFDGDYKPVGGSSAVAFGMQYQHGGITGSNLYNGNISHSTVAISQIGNSAPVGYTYRYDQLNRLKEMRQQALANNTTTWNSSAPGEAYSESITYDGNGNILTDRRNGPASQLAMDRLGYVYNRDSQGRLTNNRLRYVRDTVTDATTQPQNITGQTDNNYQYDAIGNLVKDQQSGITNIDWSVYGKIRTITKSDNSTIGYAYDASGNRVSKTVGARTYWYVRDAQGNVLALYDNPYNDNNIYWEEQHLYGSSRLGMWKPGANLSSQTGGSLWDYTGKRFFELTNHLGNVLALISDNRWPSGNGSYNADVTRAQDYYPFGMTQPGRYMYAAAIGEYRYGFNGKENDNEVGKGDGNQQDYGMRIYDNRLGRFLSVDPISKNYPWYTPYQFAGNTPIWATDIDGEEEYIYQLKQSKNAQGKPALAVQFVKESDSPLLPNAIEPDSYKLRDVNGKLFEFNFGSRKELMQAVHGKTLGQIRAASAAKAESDVTQASLIVAWQSMLEMQGKIESFASSHDFEGFENSQGSFVASPKRVVSAKLKVSDIEGGENQLYRFDTRSPEQIKAAGGFNSWGYNMDLLEHASGSSIFDRTSGYVPTTSSLKSIYQFSKGRNGYIYTLKPQQNGIIVNQRLGAESPFPEENEVAVPLRIPATDIIDVKKIENNP